MIRSIRIQNFKSLRDVTVEFSPVTVLVGRSGTGKSNFVSAVRLFRDVLRTLGSQPDDWRYMRCETSPKEPLTFVVEFALPGLDHIFQYRLSIGRDFVLREERFSVDSQTYFEQSVHRADGSRGPITWITAPPTVRPPDTGSVALGRLPGLELASVAFSALTLSIGVYDFPLNVLRSANPSANTRFGLNDEGSNYLQVLHDLAGSHQRIRVRKAITDVLAKINPSVSSIDIDSLQNPSSAIVGHRSGGLTLPLRLEQESSGFRRFYAYMLALYQSPPKLLMAFEEPENGIHPGALSLLAQEFKLAPEENRGQLLLTTHSPALLDQFAADEIRVVELVDLETRIGPLSSEQKESINEHLLFPGELLTVDPARIDMASEVPSSP